MLPHKSRLEKLELESLELRRLRTDLIFVYKLLFGPIRCSDTLLFPLKPTRVRVYVCVSVCICVYIYIYIICVCMSVCVCVCV